MGFNYELYDLADNFSNANGNTSAKIFNTKNNIKYTKEGINVSIGELNRLENEKKRLEEKYNYYKDKTDDNSKNIIKETAKDLDKNFENYSKWKLALSSAQSELNKLQSDLDKLENVSIPMPSTPNTGGTTTTGTTGGGTTTTGTTGGGTTTTETTGGGTTTTETTGENSKKINTKKYLIIGGSVLILGIVSFFAFRKN